MLARALISGGVEHKRREVYFYAVDLDLCGWVSIDSVYYMPNLPTLHIGAAAIQCRMNVIGSPVHAQDIKVDNSRSQVNAAHDAIARKNILSRALFIFRRS